MNDSLSEAIRAEHAAAWERVVTHPLVQELGDGTLPIDKFRAYFVQDYIFVKDLVAVMGLMIAKSPDLGSASAPISRFLEGGILLLLKIGNLVLGNGVVVLGRFLGEFR